VSVVISTLRPTRIFQDKIKKFKTLDVAAIAWSNLRSERNVEIFCCLSKRENFENFDEDLVDIYDQHKYLKCKKLILKNRRFRITIHFRGSKPKQMRLQQI
jgi:hypothetical protein